MFRIARAIVVAESSVIDAETPAYIVYQTARILVSVIRSVTDGRGVGDTSNGGPDHAFFLT